MAAIILVLMGLRGSGKTTLSRALALKVGTRAIDLDDRTAAVLGHAAAGEALRHVGIDAFRAAEVAALREVLAGPACILALGGGTPTAPGAADLLRPLKRASPPRVVYLRASPATLADRLSRDPADRPSLTGLPVTQEIQSLYDARDPLYATLADRVVVVDGRTEAAVLEELVLIAGLHVGL